MQDMDAKTEDVVSTASLVDELRTRIAAARAAAGSAL